MIHNNTRFFNTIYFTVFLLIIVSCGSSTKKSEVSSDDSKEVIKKPVEIEQEIIIEAELPPREHNPLTYHGFIGNNAITAILDFDDSKGDVNGYYFYDKNQKYINLYREISFLI